MILQICSLILPPSKRELLTEAWSADLAEYPEGSSARFLLGLQLVLASIKIRIATDASGILVATAVAAAAAPIVLIYLQFSLFREVLVAAVFLTAYRFRNLAATRLNRALLASAVQMLIAATFSWSFSYLVRDSAAFNSFWQSFGLMPNWVPIGLGLLTLASAVVALSLWAWAAIKTNRLSILEKAIFGGVLLTSFPELVWQVSDSILRMGGMLFAEPVVVAISKAHNRVEDFIPILVLAGLLLYFGRTTLNRVRHPRG